MVIFSKENVKLATICIFMVIIIIGCNKSDDSRLSKIEGVLIYGDWDSYIYANKNEEVTIQIPVYDFSKELSEYSVSVENFNIGKVNGMKMVPQNKFKYFEQYTLEFTLIPEKTGLHHIENLKIIVKSKDKRYEEAIGKWTFEVGKPNKTENIIVTGGSLYEPWTENYISDYEYRSDIVNKNNENMEIESLTANNKNISIYFNDNISIKPNEEKTITAIINISNTSGNVYLRPKLTYTINGKSFSSPTNLTLYASTVPMDELMDILKVKGMMKE